MPSAATNMATVAALAFMRDHHSHACGLSDDAAEWLDTPACDVGDEAPCADATDFFVVRKREVQWAFQTAAQKLGDKGQPGRAKALHVCHASTVQAFAYQSGLERIGFPRLPAHGNDIGMTGQDDATVSAVAVARRQCGEQVRLAPIIIESEIRRDTVGCQVVSYPMNQ